MKLVAIAALIAVCGAAKLDRTYLPPPSAVTAGGSSDSLQTPLTRSSSGQEESSGSLPTGSYTNNFQGVVVDAAAAGIRASPDGDQSGLGGPRDSYGSTNSKVGDAAFRGSVAGFRSTPTFGNSGLNGQVLGTNAGHNLGAFESKSERPQASKDRNSNVISYANDVSPDNYSYGFETDNGIVIGENGVANNGIQAQGGYSYKGDDGQVYKVTYVADEGGYRPQGDHLPTPPPIPKEILESLEQNAKEEAAGLVDDGSYDAQKYNAEGDYTHHNSGNIQYNGAQVPQFAKRPESDATASSSFINQNSHTSGKPTELSSTGAQNIHSNFNAQSNGHKFGSNFVNNQNVLTGSQDKESSHTLSKPQETLSTGTQNSGQFGLNTGSHLTSQFGQTQGAFGSQSSQFEHQNGQQAPTTQFGSQSSQFGSLANQQGSATQFGGQSSQLESQANQQGSVNQFGGQTNQGGSASQFGGLPSKPIFGQDSNFALNSQSNQGTQFNNQAFKPQGSFSSPAQAQNGFGQPSQYNDEKQGQSQVSQTQSSYKPSFGGSNLNKPSVIDQSQSHTIASTVTNNGNRFPNTPNQFNSEYLPPFNLNNRPAYNKPQTNEVSNHQESSKNNQTPNFVPLEGQNQGPSQGSSASAFASVGPNGFEPQPFQSQPSKPNKFNYNSQNQLTSQGQTELNDFPTSQSGSNNVLVSAAGTKPTAIPETELTTPLETYEQPASSQGSQSNIAMSIGNYGSQSLNNKEQPQIGFQSNVAATGQTLTPSFPDSRPQGTAQFSSSSITQSVFSPTQEPGFNVEKPHSPQNSYAQNQHNNAYYATQKPSLSQGPVDSYYYNQPSKPFNSPIARPQETRFPSSPSHQSNGVAFSQNNQYSNQQGTLPSSTKFPNSPSLAPAVPTPSAQFTYSQGNPSTNYNNGITQAAISSFPLTSPTTSTQYDTTQADHFGSKPSLNQQSSQQHLGAPSFPSKPISTFGQNPSNSFSQNQNQFGQSSTNNNNQPSVVQSFPSKPVTSSGQTPTTSFAQNQIQFGQSSSTNNDQPHTPEINQEQQTTSTLTQQYQGTVYEYNKPAEVLPAPAQTESSSSQSIETNSPSKPQEGQEPITQESKPQFESQQAQFGQSTFSSQYQQSSLTQGVKPQFSTQPFKPFGSSPSSNTQFSQNTQSTLSQTSLQQNTQGPQGSVQSVKPNESALATTQFGQNSQANLGPRPQYGSQSIKPFNSLASSPSQFGQNTQQPQGTGHTTSHQNIQGSYSSTQQFKPFGGAQSSNNQFGQNTQTNLQGITTQQHSGSQFAVQPNKPFGSASSPASFGQVAQTQDTGFTQHSAQGSQIGTQLFKPFGTTSTTQGAQPIKPFGTTGTDQGFQGYPSSKPQFGTQLTQTQFSQTSQQTFGATQITAQPARESQADVAKPFANTSSIHGSPDSQKPHFSQNIQQNQGTQPSGSSFGQQSFQNSQFGSSASNPQFGTQTQFGQNQNASPNKPLGVASSQAQFGPNVAQASSSAMTQQEPQDSQAYKPFGALSTPGSQNKPQFDQAAQFSQGASTITSQSQFGAQPFKPFSSSGTLSQNKPQASQNKPSGSQQSSSCCQGGSKDSSIGPLNVGKPSQAFAQTQSQFTGFPGAQSINTQSVAGKGEEFGGPRQPPRFDDQTGYHY